MTRSDIEISNRKALLIQYPIFKDEQIVGGITTDITLPWEIKPEKFSFHTKINDLLGANPDALSFLSKLYGQPSSEIKGKLAYGWLRSEITFNDQGPIYQIVLTPSLSDPYSVRIEPMFNNDMDGMALVQDSRFIRTPLSPNRQIRTLV